MAKKEFLDKSGLTIVIDLIKEKFAAIIHTHSVSDITDYKVDNTLLTNSTNPVQNQVVKEALDLKVPITRTVNGKSLEADINLSASDVGTMTSDEIQEQLDSLDIGIEITKEDYDKLGDSVLDGKTYFIIDAGNEGSSAKDIPFSNKASGLKAINVQDAIDELKINGNGSGSIDLTEAEYKELEASGEVDSDITYYITDASVEGILSSGIIELTQEEYDVLPDEEKNNGAIYAITDAEDLAAKNMAYDGSITGLGTTVQEAIDNCFQSVSDGKALVASAIADKGVETASDATFEIIANNIRNIETGIDTSDATATAAMITEGYTAYVNGELIVGTRPAPLSFESNSVSGYLNGGRDTTHSILFSSPFDTTPTVSVKFTSLTDTNGDSEWRYASISYSSVTKTGFNVYVHNGDSIGLYYTFYWEAVV